MNRGHQPDFSMLDRPEILRFLFHPRPESTKWASGEADSTVMIPVETDISVGARFHLTSPDGPNILFFHGNGEIVADYNELAGVYNSLGINFLPVDYRGYGRSGGSPTVAAMMKDCLTIFEFVTDKLDTMAFHGPLIVMGRSLGSASAIEVAVRRTSRIRGLIVESGFAFAGPLLRLLGVDVRTLGLTESVGFGNVDKIRSYKKPLMIIHAERDHIIPFSDGQALYDACTGKEKVLVKIPGANHNDIFAVGMRTYMNSVGQFAGRLLGTDQAR